MAKVHTRLLHNDVCVDSQHAAGAVDGRICYLQLPQTIPRGSRCTCAQPGHINYLSRDPGNIDQSSTVLRAASPLNTSMFALSDP